MVKALRKLIAQNRSDDAVAIPSVCSAQPDVLSACLQRAQTLDRMIVIEATSNQVNQDGGYTGMTPADFVGFVQGLARDAGVDRERIILGGDHLGLQAWRSQPSELGLAKAHTLVHDYVTAGFHKIHLDCSEGCAGEAAQLDDAVIAARSMALAGTCFEAMDDPSELLFVVGTEVPPPGGARADEDGDIAATTPEAARATMAAHAAAFGDMSPLIGGLVVPPGVEFSPMAVHALPMDRGPMLAQAIGEWDGVCLEAHPTDYQAPEVFPRLAALGFAFQKVGPALTHAYREALYALDAARCGARLRDDLAVGVSDKVLAAVFAPQVLERAEALQGTQVQRLIDAQIQLALDPYFFEGVA